MDLQPNRTSSPRVDAAAVYLPSAPSERLPARRRLRTLKRQVERVYRPLALRLVLFEWPIESPEEFADFHQAFPNDMLPWGSFATWGEAAEFGSGPGVEPGWAYTFQTFQSADPADAQADEFRQLFAAVESVVKQSWAPVVADLTGPELSRRFTWGRWAADGPPDDVVHARDPQPETGVSPAFPAWPAMRTLHAPRADAMPQCLLIEDYVLASLLALDTLIAGLDGSEARAAGADEPKENAATGGPENAEGGAVAEGAPPFAWVREGDVWRIKFEGRAMAVPHAKGLKDIFELIRTCPDPVAAVDLDRRRGAGAAKREPLATAKHVRELRAELSDLQELGSNPERVDAISGELARVTGIRGRIRYSDHVEDAARLAVTKRIAAAIEKLRARDAALARHLDNCIKRGRDCVYEPDHPIIWVLSPGQ